MTHPDAPFPEKSPEKNPEKNPGGDAKGKSTHKSTPVWLETIVLLVIALLLAVGIKTFFVQPFYIPSASMEPGLIKNDRILVEKMSYWGSGTPQRGDVVVFKDPGGWLPPSEEGSPTNPVTRALSFIGLYPTGGHLVKRVIGVGGDHVSCSSAKGPLMVNGHALSESSYLPRGARPCASYPPFSVTVPAGHLWVMGDNRGDSADSRAHIDEPGRGFVADDLVVGKVVARVWPLSRFETIHRPATFAGVPDSAP